MKTGRITDNFRWSEAADRRGNAMPSDVERNVAIMAEVKGIGISRRGPRANRYIHLDIAPGDDLSAASPHLVVLIASGHKPVGEATARATWERRAPR